MKKRLLLLGLSAAIVAGGAMLILRLDGASISGSRSAWDGIIDAAMVPSDCPVPAPRIYAKGHYVGPLIDAHIHIPSIPDDPSFVADADDDGARPSLGVNVTIAEMACLFETEGTMMAFAFFPVWPELPEQMVEVVRRSTEAYPNLFVPFIMPPNHDDDPRGSPTVDADMLREMLAIVPGLFEGYGEIGLYARDHGSPELPPDAELLREIYPVVREQKMLVYLHLGVDHDDNLEIVLDQYPDVSFIFHGDQLIAYGEEGRQDLSRVDALLSDHPNLYYGVDELYGDEFLLRPEVSKEAFLAHFADYEPLLEEDLATWKAFIEKHPDQVLWDTDRGGGAPWSLDVDVGLQLTDYARAFIGRLDPAVQEKYAYKNALRLSEK